MLIKPPPKKVVDDQNPDIAGGGYLASGNARSSGTIMAVINIRRQWKCSEGVGKGGGGSGLRAAAAEESFL